MTANAETLDKISSIIQAELPKYLRPRKSSSTRLLDRTDPDRTTRTTCTSALSLRTTIPGWTRRS